MPPSRSDVSLASVSAYFSVILTFSVVLTILSVHDSPAGGPPIGRPTESLGGVDSPEAMRVEPIRTRGRVDRGFSLSPRRRPDGFLARPLTSWSTLAATRGPSLFPVRSPQIANDGRIAGTTANEVKPLPFADGNAKANVTIRRGPWTTPKPPREPVALKPTLAGGAAYRSAGQERSGRFMMDFVLPARVGSSSVLFFESRAEYRDPLFRIADSPERRFDLGMGVGWRKVWDDRVMIGINGFWDTSRMYGDWYSSPGFGFEFAAATYRSIWDITLNVYRGGGIDLKGGVTLPILEDHLDMRLYAEKYRFFDGEFILGSKAGVQISSPNRLITISYEYGQDSRNPEYHAIGCSLTVPFSLEKAFAGKNPFEVPVSKSSAVRYAQRVQSEGVKRAWSNPDTVVEARRTAQGKRWTTPGRLTDSVFWSKNKATADAKEPNPRPKPEPKKPQQARCCCKREKADKGDNDTSLGSALIWWLLSDSKTGTAGSALFSTACLAGATYLTGDYAYRNAFGPFELEPYEVDRIKREMPKRHRGK